MMPRTQSLLTDSRGQTVIDYAIGVSIFLVIVGGVLLYIPTIFEPFTTSTTTEAIIADNTATLVSKELLTTTGSAGTANVMCTAALFSGDESLDTHCGFTADAPLRETLGIPEDSDVNMFITPTTSTINTGVVSKQVNGDAYTFQRQTNTDKRNTAVATRVIQLEGESYRLVVEVW